jgi:hypothetical protein
VLKVRRTDDRELSFLASVNDDRRSPATARSTSTEPTGAARGGTSGAHPTGSHDLFSTPTVVTELSSTQRHRSGRDAGWLADLVLEHAARRLGPDVWLSADRAATDRGRRGWSPHSNSPSVDAGTPNAASMDRSSCRRTARRGVAFDPRSREQGRRDLTAPTAIRGLVTPFNETDPFLTGDGEQLWFDPIAR